MKLRLLLASELRVRLLRSASWLLARRLVTMANSLVLGVLIAAHLGPEDFAVLNYVVSLIAIVMPLTELGLRDLALREYARNPDQTDRILGTVAALRGAGTIAAILIVYVVVTFFPIGHEHIAILCLLVSGALLFQTIDTIKEKFIAEQKPRVFVIVNVVIILFFAAVKIGLILADFGVNAFIVTLACETVLQALAAAYAYRLMAGAFPRLEVDFALMREYASVALPLTLSGLSALVFLKIDILFLSNMVSKTETGQYALAARMSEAWYMLPATLALAAVPRMIEVRAVSQERYTRRMQDAMDTFAAFGMFIAVTSIWWAEPFILILFGESYAGAIPLLQIQAWVGVVFATRQLTVKWLLTEGLYWGIAWVNFCGACCNILLNLLLIPRYGAEGAAYATIISYALAPLMLAPFVPSLRPVAIMQLKAIFWFRRLFELALSRGKTM